MKTTYRVEIWKEGPVERDKIFWGKKLVSEEKIIFQILLSDKDLDLKGVLKKIVSGKEVSHD